MIQNQDCYSWVSFFKLLTFLFISGDIPESIAKENQIQQQVKKYYNWPTIAIRKGFFDQPGLPVQKLEEGEGEDQEPNEFEPNEDDFPDDNIKIANM